jgi:hypothetical protein
MRLPFGSCSALAARLAVLAGLGTLVQIALIIFAGLGLLLAALLCC